MKLRSWEKTTGGYIALQAESHPCQFRKIETLKLDQEWRVGYLPGPGRRT
jgi:hypothetical protein